MVEYIVAIDVTRVRFPADALIVGHGILGCPSSMCRPSALLEECQAEALKVPSLIRDLVIMQVCGPVYNYTPDRARRQKTCVILIWVWECERWLCRFSMTVASNLLVIWYRVKTKRR